MVFNYLLHRYPGLLFISVVTGFIFLPSLAIQHSSYWGIETKSELNSMVVSPEDDTYLIDNILSKKNDDLDLAFALAVSTTAKESSSKSNVSSVKTTTEKTKNINKKRKTVKSAKRNWVESAALSTETTASKGIQTWTTIAPCVNDATSPIFSFCPANITATTQTECTQIYWDMPVAADNCNVSTLDFDYAPNTCFPLGTTSVNYTATDLSGNQTKCTFKVTVINSTNTPSNSRNIKVFETKKDRKGVLLQWVTQANAQIEYFIIQKTDASGEFQGLDIVDGSTSSENMAFHYYDTEPTVGESVYRVKAILSDGNFQYSEANKVAFNKFQEKLIQYNTGDNFIKFDLSRFEGKSVEVRFINQLGQTIETANVEEATEIPVKLDISHLTNGAYFIHMIPFNDEKIMKKLFLQK